MRLGPHKALLAAVLVTASALLILGACGGDDSAEPATPPVPAETSEAAQPVPEPPAPPEPEQPPEPEPPPDPDTPPEPAELTKEEYIAQADVICTELNERTDAVGDTASFTTFEDFEMWAAGIEEISADGLPRLQALEPPVGDQDGADRTMALVVEQSGIVAEVGAAAAALDEDALVAAVDSLGEIGAEIDTVAAAYGFQVCGLARDSEPALEPEPPPAAEEFTTPTGIACWNPPPDPPLTVQQFEGPFALDLTEGATYTATLETGCGTITLELDPVNTPLTTNNFVELARAGFYDGVTFHRAVGGFVIQGGDPLGDGTGGPGYEFEDELPTDGYTLGDLAMANAGPNTNGSQFFIVTGDASFLGNDFSKFGRVLEGLDVAQGIESLGDPSVDPTIEPTYIYSVTITES